MTSMTATAQRGADALVLPAITNTMSATAPATTTTAANVTSGKSKKELFLMQRAERLKDPKRRHMGIDRQALDEQVREKAALRRLEQERDAYYDRQALVMDRHACALQQEVNHIRAMREKELQDFRQTYQKKGMAREWDLNDPLARRKELPARVGDDDPRNGTASLQRLAGEDLDYAARRRAQQQQQHAWAEQQVNEKLAKKWMEQQANRAYEARNEETNYRTYEIERQIAAQRTQRTRDTAAFNQALQEQQRREAVRAREEDTRLALREIAYQMNSDFLTERESVVNALGASVKSERYKGMTDAQIQRLRSEQAEQLQQLRRRRLMDVEEAKQWAQQENMQLRMAAALDRQRERERRAERVRLAEVHKQQMSAAAQRKATLDDLYTNQIDEDYYKYWNRCV